MHMIAVSHVICELFDYKIQTYVIKNEAVKYCNGGFPNA